MFYFGDTYSYLRDRNVTQLTLRLRFSFMNGVGLGYRAPQGVILPGVLACIQSAAGTAIVMDGTDAAALRSLFKGLKILGPCTISA
jgi:hypothetical protein